jgi:2-polyprenyl-3-methyl-5-hydroxy-6-metoxy-1,4-benzoquinol methylase
VNTQIESDFFDSFESRYGDYDVLGEMAYRRLLNRFEEQIHPKAEERCIDLGCGTGAFTRRLNAFHLQLTGVDISSKCIDRAKQKASGETYTVGDLRKLQFASESADIIVYSGVLHHIPQTAERFRALREGLRILKPGGRLFAYDPNKASPSMWLYRSPQSPFYSQAGKTENEVLLSRQDILQELRSAGFTNIRVQGLSGTTFRFVESKAARAILPLYNMYEIFLMLSPFQRRLGTFLISSASKRSVKRNG